ncbi:BamA/TamA family outer membrane protein [Francisellaceae bacterium]|nr:BamA/TamA family outer membrane protein [Francisellaceae bacterium]
MTSNYFGKVFILIWVLLLTPGLLLAEIKTDADKKNNLSIMVNVTGLPDKIKEGVMPLLSIIKYQNYATESASRLYLMYGESKNEILDLVEPYGYFNASVTSEIKLDGQDWEITYHVTLGEPVKIDLVDIAILGEGQLNTKFLEIIHSSPLKEGEVLTQENYNDAKNSLLSTASVYGFFDAKLVKNEIQINKAKNIAKIYLTLDSGAQYRINKINLTQKQYTFYKNFVGKFIDFDQKQPFSANKIQKTISNLQSSSYFTDIRVVPQITDRNKKDKTVDVDVDLTASKPVTYAVGGGWGTFTGFRALGETVFHHLTPSGDYATITVEISQINLSYIGQYIIPGDDPLNNFWSINGQQNLINLIPYNSLQTNAGLNNIYKNRWLVSNLGIQQYYITYNTPAQSDTQSSYYLVPSWFLTLDLTTDGGFWKKGFTINNNLQGTIENPLSSSSFLRNLTRIEFAWPIMPEWNRIILSTNIGFLGFTPAADIAPQFRFYAGGVGSLLGYGYLSQGPTNSQGQLVGGRYLGTVAAGLQQRVYGNFSVIGYYNAGNATDEIDFSDVEILRAAGLGVGYETPLGSIQCYLTRTLNPNDQHWRFDFSLGVLL